MKLLTAKAIAEAWGLPLPRIYELARTGVIPSVRIGRQVRFPEDALRDWIRSGGK
ncbi:MAG: helix-turn-helix domain-containing protein [Blastocatellia bacterium]